jgi:hypothetical protein
MISELASESESTTGSVALAKPRVLVIDDEEDQRTLLAMLLERAG